MITSRKTLLHSSSKADKPLLVGINCETEGRVISVDLCLVSEVFLGLTEDVSLREPQFTGARENQPLYISRGQISHTNYPLGNLSVLIFF